MDPSSWGPDVSRASSVWFPQRTRVLRKLHGEMRKGFKTPDSKSLFRYKSSPQTNQEPTGSHFATLPIPSDMSQGVYGLKLHFEASIVCWPCFHKVVAACVTLIAWCQSDLSLQMTSNNFKSLQITSEKSHFPQFSPILLIQSQPCSALWAPQPRARRMPSACPRSPSRTARPKSRGRRPGRSTRRPSRRASAKCWGKYDGKMVGTSPFWSGKNVWKMCNIAFFERENEENPLGNRHLSRENENLIHWNEAEAEEFAMENGHRNGSFAYFYGDCPVRKLLKYQSW